MGGVKGIGAGIAKGIAEDFQSGSHSIFVLQARTGFGKLDGVEWEATFDLAWWVSLTTTRPP